MTSTRRSNSCPERSACHRRRWLAAIALFAVVAGGCGELIGPRIGEPASLRLSTGWMQLVLGEEAALAVTVHDANGREIPASRRVAVVWSSSDSSVATVEEGVIRSVGGGHASVMAQVAGLPPATVEVDVLVPTSIVLSTDTLKLVRGVSLRVHAAVRDQHGAQIPALPSAQALHWSSADPTVVSVVDGLLRAEGQGQAIVTVRSGDRLAGQVAVTVAAIAYRAEALGAMSGTQSNAWVVNSSGLVGGWSNASGGRAFRWTAEEGMADLLGVPSGVRGINDAGAIVGYFNHATGSSGFVLHDGIRHDLRPLVPGYNTTAFRISESGTVTGTSDPAARAVYWRRGADGLYGAPTDLGFRSQTDRPLINGRGDIVFNAFGEFLLGLSEPMFWRARADGSLEAPIRLGRPAGGSYFAQDINDAGLVVGFRWSGMEEIAVLWHPRDYANPIDLGVGVAAGINARNHIVGTIGGELPTFGGLPVRPVLWTVDAEGVVSGPFDLGTPAGSAFGGARWISNSGWIVGSTWSPGQVVATLWRPE